ncbi:MAG: signal recognition particle-docking protein FtsY [Rhodospirillales bacterium]|nr:signal recognition particle-docking protein FtsY [Rhodospirillales bacterium]
MVFWRKNKNDATQEAEDKAERILHRSSDPDLEPPTEYEAELSEDLEHELFEETTTEILDDLDVIPTPRHSKISDIEEARDLGDHAAEGGWLARLTKGLSKSSKKIGQGISDLVTKKKLDQETLDSLEELLISADLGPKTAAKIIEDFSRDRFGKEIEEQEIREALASGIAKILEPVATPLTYPKPENGGPFVVLVCGVNGVGKTTTIGKMAHYLHVKNHRSVMMAAGDTFRAAAIEQLQEWAKRAHCKLMTKEVGADAAAVAYEAYEQAKAENVDVLFIDTAGRLHNKANLMAELEKIVRVLKKQDENLPHATLLVLDATTGQNAHEQVRTFKEMVDVTGLIVTKLDGSARGGVVVALADEFNLPINLIGVGEQAQDLQSFHAEEFARSLVGLKG